MPLLSTAIYKKIETQANKLLKDHKVDSPPVSVERIAKSIGVDVIPYEMGNEISGILVLNEGKGTIGYNPSQSKTRQRFTISHELGHFVLHAHSQKELFVDKDFIVKFRSKKTYSRAEIIHESEANAFAAALLMPKEFIMKELYKKKNQDLTETELIEELARAFDVSIPAMTYRLSDLNVFV
ncbi:MAG TPA: ImmA/IrrE family metallo-endopeptidase [Chryseosolibacter sp.]